MNFRILWVLFLVLLIYACGGDGGDSQPAPEPELESLDNCLVSVSSETFEVATWNIENYPQSSNTAELVEQIIETYNLDMIAVQEITSQALFQNLVNELAGWEGFTTQINGSNLMLGYLYKTSEVSLVGDAINLYAEDNDTNNDAFTAFRRPYMVEVNHSSGLNLHLINVHLKCCNGSEDRRRNASVLIKDYIDNNLANEEVMVLGDFNDEIVDTDNVFQNFIDDSQSYRFSTMDIAEGASSEWSYPSLPSQIDQILISDELFDNEQSTQTIKVDECLSTYSSHVSDHRPVLITFSAN